MNDTFTNRLVNAILREMPGADVYWQRNNPTVKGWLITVIYLGFKVEYELHYEVANQYLPDKEAELTTSFIGYIKKHFRK